MGAAPGRVYQRFVKGERVRGRQDEQCPENFRGRSGTVLGYYLGSGCLVRFDDDGAEEYAYSHWLEGIAPTS